MRRTVINLSVEQPKSVFRDGTISLEGDVEIVIDSASNAIWTRRSAEFTYLPTVKIYKQCPDYRIQSYHVTPKAMKAHKLNQGSNQ